MYVADVEFALGGVARGENDGNRPNSYVIISFIYSHSVQHSTG